MIPSFLYQIIRKCEKLQLQLQLQESLSELLVRITMIRTIQTSKLTCGIRYLYSLIEICTVFVKYLGQIM